MTIDEQIAQAGVECDDRFDALQPEMVAAFRALGVSEAEMPEVLSYAYDEYERSRGALLDHMRSLLQRLAVAQAAAGRLEAGAARRADDRVE